MTHKPPRDERARKIRASSPDGRWGRRTAGHGRASPAVPAVDRVL